MECAFVPEYGMYTKQREIDKKNILLMRMSS